MHICGQSVKSCRLPVVQTDGLRCGFFTPGMIMSALGLLVDRNIDPGEREICEGLEGNLCRCTGYHNIVKAVRAAAGAKRG